jgi:hypothetical protein
MELRPDALRFALGQGLAAEARVGSDSMAPSLPRGVALRVEAIGGEPDVGDVVLIFTGRDTDPVLHRVMHLYSEGTRRFVMHQGDAPASAFATCPLGAVMARAVGFASDPARPLPTLDRLGPEEMARFRRRRRACSGFAWARRVGAAIGLRERALGRRLARLYRALARAVVG